ncbi:protein FAM76B [Helianthus annuus]|nr:protein FAM76B [Helianthus annuus]
MACCKEKAVLVAVYKENPSKRRLTTRNSDNIKHHHHHHHHHLHIHQSKDNKGNRRAELLSYSQRLRESSKVKASTPPHHAKPLVASTSNDQETAVTQAHEVQKKQKLKKQSSPPDMKTIFKCFAMSHAKRKVKKNKKKKSSESASKKANVIMKKFNSRTQKGARRFFSKLKAIIQKYR